MAAGTATVAETTYTSAKKIRWAWTSGDGGEGGTVTSPTTKVYDGKLVGFTTNPGGTAPTDDYDITITDADGDDVLLGAGTDRDAANTEHVAEGSLSAVAGSVLTLNVTNAGDAKEGVVILWIR